MKDPKNVKRGKKNRDSKGRFIEGHEVLGNGMQKAIEYNKLNGVWNKNKKLRNRTKLEKQKTSETMKKNWKNPTWDNKKRNNKISKTLEGHEVSNKTRKKIRKAVSRHVKKVGGPLLGKQEKQILDNIEEFIEFKIIRQYPICGYFVDGYFEEANVVFEIDERPKIKERDIERENIIKNELNCTFVRVPTYEI